jgi:uncharacterized membrane protein
VGGIIIISQMFVLVWGGICSERIIFFCAFYAKMQLFPTFLLLSFINKWKQFFSRRPEELKK